MTITVIITNGGTYTTLVVQALRVILSYLLRVLLDPNDELRNTNLSIRVSVHLRAQAAVRGVTTLCEASQDKTVVPERWRRLHVLQTTVHSGLPEAHHTAPPNTRRPQLK